RQIVQACVQYTVEYKGSYPYGFIYNYQSATGRPVTIGNPTFYITWFSSCDKYMSPRANELIPLDANSGYYDGASRRVFSKAFRCPTVPQNDFKQQVQFYQNGIIMPHMTLELPSGGAGFRPPTQPPITAPAKVNQVYPDNALF